MINTEQKVCHSTEQTSAWFGSNDIFFCVGESFESPLVLPEFGISNKLLLNKLIVFDSLFNDSSLSPALLTTSYLEY